MCEPHTTWRGLVWHRAGALHRAEIPYPIPRHFVNSANKFHFAGAFPYHPCAEAPEIYEVGCRHSSDAKDLPYWHVLEIRFLRTQIIQLASSSYAAWALTLHPRVGVENLAVFEVSVLIELDLFVVFFCFCGLGLIGCLWIKVSCLRIFCRLSSTFSFSSRLVQWILPIGRVSLLIYFSWIYVFWMDDLRHFFGLKCLVLIRKYSVLFCSHGVFP